MKDRDQVPDDARYHFNYSREEREARTSRKSAGKPQTLFSRHRGTIIVLFDLMIIAVVFVVFRGFLIPEPHRDALAGYELELQAVPDGDEVTIRVRVVSTDTGGHERSDAPQAQRSGLLEVRVPADPDTPQLAELMDLVPTGDRPRIVQTQVARESIEGDEITARVTIDDAETTLRARLRN